MSKWIVNTYTFSPIQGGYFVTQGNLNYTLISGNLTLNAGDTSKVTFVVPKSVADDLYPVRTLVEVKFGNGLNPERKFFGTVVKKTRMVPEGTYRFDAVGVLGSYQFLPNYNNYGADATVGGIISVESQRFRGYYQSGSPYYTPSPWEMLYSGHNEIPSAFGSLTGPYANLKLTCNLESLQKQSKNAYEFLKAITNERSFILPEDYVNPPYIFRWFENGETARFGQIAGENEQAITYDTNLISCSLAEEPYYTRVVTYGNSGGTYYYNEQSGNGYPCPFNYARIPLPNKADGSAYTYVEVQNATRGELKKYPQLIEATAFDRHIVDESVPWLDLSKRVYVFYAPDEYVKAEITQIVYDFADPTKDRVKLGKIVQTATDSIATANEQIASNIETEVTEKLQMYEPIVAYGTEISANANLNTSTYVNVGLYYRADNATVATFTNCPTTVGFSMLVRNVSKTDADSSSKTWQYLTREITDINGNQFIQTAFCGSTVGVWVFGDWKQIIAGRKTGTLTANVGSFDEAYCRQSGDTVDIHGWLVGLSTSDSSHANAIKVSGVSLPSVPIRFVFTCWLNNGIASYAGYGVLDTYGNITLVKPIANSNKVSFTITYVV